MQGEGLFSRDHQPNRATFKVAKSKIQELILQHPTDYSQSRPAARIMLEAHGSKDVEKFTTSEYEWSKIFPVARRVSRSFLFVGSGQSTSLDEEITTTTHFVCEVHFVGKRSLKLPQIEREGDEILHKKCGYGRTQLAKEPEPLRSTNNEQKISESILGFTKLLPLQSHRGLDEAEAKRMIKCNETQDNENTGLVIKLPEIVNVRL